MFSFVISATDRRNVIRFQTQSGELNVDREGNRLVLDFPSRPAKETGVSEALADSLGAQPEQHLARARLHRGFCLRSRRWRRSNLTWARCETGRARRGRHRAGRQLRFCLSLFCARRRHSGRSGDRFDALHADSLLVASVSGSGTFRAPNFAARRRIILRRSRRARRDRRRSRHLRGRENLSRRRRDRQHARRVRSSELALAVLLLLASNSSIGGQVQKRLRSP